MLVFQGLLDLLLRDEAGDDADAGGGGGVAPAEGGADVGGEPAPIPGDVEVIPLPEEPADGEGDPEPGTPADERARALADGTNRAAAGDAAYQPKFKYEVNRVEKDMPEWVRPLVTDAETEKNVRDLLERSDGLDAVKASREAVGRERDEVKTNYGRQTQAITALTNLARQGIQGIAAGDVSGALSFQSFFEALQIPEEAILRYAAHRAHTLSDPQLLAQYEAARQTHFEQTHVSGERDFYRQEAIRASSVARSTELDIAMARPDVMAASKAFDTRLGRVGAFRAQVIQSGAAHAAMNKGADLGVNDAINHVISLAGLAGGAQPASAAGAAGSPPVSGAAGQPPNAAPRQAPAKKPVLPNIAGTGASPVAVVPKSIKQLREMGQRAAAEGR